MGIVIGIAGPIFNAAQPFVAEEWFSHKERVTATTISIVILYVATSSLLGLYMVRDCDGSTSKHGGNTSYNGNSSCVGNSTAVSLIGNDVSELAYVECCIAGLLFVAVLAYFPSRPPTPPSVSATTPRIGFCNSLKSLRRNKRIWLIVVTGGLSNGVFLYWLAMLPDNVQQLNIDQKQAAWMTFYSSVGTVVAGVTSARIIDYFSGKMKAVILFLLAGGLLAVAWLEMQLLGVGTLSVASTYSSVILAGVFIPTTYPLLIELGCETAYPVPEGVVGGLMTVASNIVSVVFLLLFLVPDIGISWINWVMLGSLFTSVVAMAVFKEQYTRMTIDVSGQRPPLTAQ